MTNDQMEKFTNDLVKQIKSIRTNAFKIGWFMRGSVSYVDLMNMSAEEIDSMNEVIDENLETTKKTKMPFF